MNEQFIPSGPRLILPGYEFDKYFPKSDNREVIVVEDGSVEDTLRQMAVVVRQYREDCKQIAALLKGRTLEETIYNIHQFIWKYIQYKLDPPGKEVLMAPRYLWAHRKTGGDCDDMTMFANTVLSWTHPGTETAFKAAAYDPATNKLQHVYDVIYNRDGSYYPLDAVIGKPFYEKPYVDKLEYNMRTNSLSGLPIHVLSGLGSTDTELDMILSGYDFASINGLSSPQSDMDALYKYLVRTRDYVLKNPNAVLFAGGADNHLKMLNYAISKWHTPERDKALAELERAEEQWNNANRLNGIEDFNTVERFDGLGRAKTKKKFFKAVADTAKKVAQGVKNVATKAVKAVVKYNPITLAVRGAMLLAMKINLFGIAKILMRGYMTDAELKANNISPDQAARSRKLAPVVFGFFKAIGGDEDNWKKSIMEGRAKKKYEGVSGLGQLGEPATIASLTAAAVPLTKIAQAIDDAGITDENGQKVGLLAKIKNFLTGNKAKNIINKAKTIIQNKIGKKDATTTDEGANHRDVAPGTDDTGSGENNEGNNDPKPEVENKALQFIKDNAVPILVGGTLLFFAGRAALQSMNKKTASPQAGFGAVKYKQGKPYKARKSSTPKKVTSITLKGVAPVKLLSR